MLYATFGGIKTLSAVWANPLYLHVIPISSNLFIVFPLLSPSFEY
jgi:hypothetical protein